MKKCFELQNLAFPISLEQDEEEDFTVLYGLQVIDHLSYYEACQELGTSIMHALTCDGKFNNEKESKNES